MDFSDGEGDNQGGGHDGKEEEEDEEDVEEVDTEVAPGEGTMLHDITASCDIGEEGYGVGETVSTAESNDQIQMMGIMHKTRSDGRKHKGEGNSLS